MRIRELIETINRMQGDSVIVLNNNSGKNEF
jgi:hypothetical protein